MKSSGLKMFISVESYVEKTAENERNCYLAEMLIVLKLIFPILIAQIGKFNEDCV